MQGQRELLEGEKAKYEAKLRNLKSYVKELTDRARKHGTDATHLEQDLMKAGHDAAFYENEINWINGVLGQSYGGAGGNGGDTGPTPTAKRSRGSLIKYSVAFLAGAFIGCVLKPRRGSLP